MNQISKPLHTKHQYTAIQTSNPSGVEIKLWSLDNPEKIKQFFIANGHGGIDRIRQHMDSLTDLLCAAFLEDSSDKKSKKQKQSK